METKEILDVSENHANKTLTQTVRCLLKYSTPNV